jgi:hypothetical protein
MQKLGETLSAGCGFTIEELQDAERAFAAAGAKVRIFCPSLSKISLSSIRLNNPSPCH